MSNQEISTFIVLRHGEPSNNKEPMLRGFTDDSLTPLGWQQMSEAVENIDDIDQIVTSPLKRCSEFASHLASKYSLSIQTADALKEINFGQWDGQAISHITKNSGEQLKQFWENPVENTPPDGEPVLEFRQRIISFWNELLMQQRGKTCLLVTHGGVQKMILSEVLKMPIQAIHNIEVPYACCSVFQVYYNTSDYLTTLKSHIHLNDNLSLDNAN